MVERLRVHFKQHPAVDWLFLRLSSGRRHITVHMGRCYDPFADILRWLEAIAIGVQECAVTWDGEGEDLRAEFLRIDYAADRGRLVVASSGRRGERFEADVSRRQMIAAIYQGFRRFVESDGYDARLYEQSTTVGAWCVESAGRRFTQGELAKLLSRPEWARGSPSMNDAWQRMELVAKLAGGRAYWEFSDWPASPAGFGSLSEEEKESALRRLFRRRALLRGSDSPPLASLKSKAVEAFLRKAGVESTARAAPAAPGFPWARMRREWLLAPSSTYAHPAATNSRRAPRRRLPRGVTALELLFRNR
jgi:hypothetical protein